MGYWIFFVVKRPELIARHHPPPSTGLRTCWNYIFTSPLCLRRSVIGWYTKHCFIDRIKIQTLLCRLSRLTTEYCNMLEDVKHQVGPKRVRILEYRYYSWFFNDVWRLWRRSLLRERFAELSSETQSYKPLQTKLECTEMTDHFQRKVPFGILLWILQGLSFLGRNARSFLSDSAMLLALLLWRWEQYIPSEWCEYIMRLHEIISQNMVFFGHFCGQLKPRIHVINFNKYINKLIHCNLHWRTWI